MAVAQDLLEILRCPYCVSGDTRKPGPDPGQLQLVRDGTWLVCLEPDCARKYPIKEDISNFNIIRILERSMGFSMVTTSEAFSRIHI